MACEFTTAAYAPACFIGAYYGDGTVAFVPASDDWYANDAATATTACATTTTGDRWETGQVDGEGDDLGGD